MFSLMMLNLLMAVQARLNIDTRPFILAGNPVALRKDDQTIEQDAGRSAILASATLMAIKQIDSAVADTPDGSNTGNGTLVATVAGPDIPKVGSWVFTCTFAITNGGVFKLEDPDGNIVADNLTLRVGDTLVTSFVAAGLSIVVTEGSTDFAAADFFTLIVVANGKWIPYDPAGILGEAVPKGIYDPESTIGDITAAALVAGDVVDMPILIEGARFDRDKLVFENSGAYTDIVLGTSKTVEEYLRTFGLIAENTIAGSAAENA